jgi:hypothetical protein
LQTLVQPEPAIGRRWVFFHLILFFVYIAILDFIFLCVILVVGNWRGVMVFVSEKGVSRFDDGYCREILRALEGRFVLMFCGLFTMEIWELGGFKTRRTGHWVIGTFTSV